MDFNTRVGFALFYGMRNKEVDVMQVGNVNSNHRDYSGYSVSSSLKTTSGIQSLNAEGKQQFQDTAVSMMISKNGLDKAREVPISFDRNCGLRTFQYESTLDMFYALYEGLEYKNTHDGSFVEILAKNYQIQAESIKEQYEGKEYDWKIALLNKAYEEAAENEGKAYVNDLRYFTGDIVYAEERSFRSEAEMRKYLAEYEPPKASGIVDEELRDQIVLDITNICMRAKTMYQDKGMLDAEELDRVATSTFQYRDLSKVCVYLQDRNADLSDISDFARNMIKQLRFNEAIETLHREPLDIPEYCGIYKTDKAIATALENCSKEERISVYGIIRRNFLIEDASSLTEEERKQNIVLGMKKAREAAENFIPEEQKQAFLDAMETVAKIANAGKADESGNMNYGVKHPLYLGHGSGLVEMTNDEDVMRTLDPDAYKEYLRLGGEGDDDPLVRWRKQLDYLHDWLAKMKKKDPNYMLKYEKRTTDYMEKYVYNQKWDFN